MFHSNGVFLMTAFFTAACAQAPAPVDLRGQNVYGRNGVVYAAGDRNTVPSYTTGGISVMAAAAPAEPIASSDLMPPSKSLALPLGEASAQTDNPINPWTHRPHFSDAASTQKGAAWPSRNVAGNNRAGHAPETEVASNFIWPVDSRHIISGFGPKGHGFVNDGINIAADDGEPVWAAADGEVVYVGNELAGYGNMVLIKHTGDKTTAYAHLGRVTVDKYARVKQGDIIGYVGTSGNVREPQLHFAIRDGKQPVDPTKYLATRVAGL